VRQSRRAEQGACACACAPRTDGVKLAKGQLVQRDARPLGRVKEARPRRAQQLDQQGPATRPGVSPSAHPTVAGPPTDLTLPLRATGSPQQPRPAPAGVSACALCRSATTRRTGRTRQAKVT
jgi:hypothetical protein